MSATAIVILSVVSALTGLAAGWLVGRDYGRTLGSDEQRVKDILELWRAMPERDARGRFKTKTT